MFAMIGISEASSEHPIAIAVCKFVDKIVLENVMNSVQNQVLDSSVLSIEK
jgi:hypothetical protein